MRTLAAVLACLAFAGHGRRVLMASQGPSGFQDVGDGHVSGHARRVNSGIDDVRGVQVRRGRSGRDDFGDGHMPRGNSGFGDMRGGHERMGRSERDDFKFGHGRNMGGGYERSGTSEPDDFKYGHGRRGRMTRQGASELHDFQDNTFRHARRGNSGFDDMRPGHGRRGASEFDDFTYGQGRGARGTSRGQSGLHDLRDDHGSGHMFRGPEFDEVKGTGGFVYKGSSGHNGF
mmetsp:Transcript_129924/g.224480  ORF Transcript_129924/g.224480 Transcript_129924/m.224480 type:complete len:231 (+) Transcript_129924:76-768(+)